MSRPACLEREQHCPTCKAGFKMTEERLKEFHDFGYVDFKCQNCGEPITVHETFTGIAIEKGF